MSDSVQSSLRADTLDVEDLVGRVRDGNVRVPAFQRGLRWTHRDVQRLFESIVRGYPIGNFLLWQRPAQASRLQIGALSIEAPKADRAWFVVDGQQRLTSLANALNAQGLDDPRFQLSYDLEKEEFVRYVASGPATQVPLPTLFDLTALLRWFSRHEDLQENPELIDRANAVAKKIRQFRVPVYIVEQTDEAVLRDIFDRMNNYGRQLTRAEVFSALNQSETGEKNPDDIGSYAQIAEQLHRTTGFGLVDDSTVFLAFLARRGPDVTREIRSEFEAQGARRVIDPSMMNEDASAAFEGALAALERAVLFLQEEARIPHFAFLPYRFLLVVLARFFAHHPTPAPASIRDMCRWTWRAALGGPSQFKGSATGATRALASRVDPDSEVKSVQNLLASLDDVGMPSFRLPVFRTNHADTRVALCALWDLRPQRPPLGDGAATYSRDELATTLMEASTAVDLSANIYDRASLPKSARVAAGNRILLAEPSESLAGSVLEVLTQAAREAVNGDLRSKQFLASHLIDLDLAGALVDGKRDDVIARRQNAIEAQTTEFLLRQTGWGFEATPPLHSLIIDDDESDERDDVASNSGGES